jgi:hypothetical protein
MSQQDPFRADAAVVFRLIRDRGPSNAAEIAREAFPWASDGPSSSLIALQRHSMRRVYDSLVWMRHHGAAVWAVPTPEGTVFSLEPMTVDPMTVRSVTVSPLRGETVTVSVTDEVTQPPSDHGSDAMGLYHPGDQGV